MEHQAGLIRGLYDSFAKGDVPTVLGAFAPDLVWNEAENFIYAAGNPYVGPQAVLEGILMRFATEWDGFSLAPEEFIGAGDTVVVRGRYRGTFKATGAAVNAQFAHIWRLRDGKVASFQQYTDTAQWRAAVTRAAAT
jgi:ketosteroid isomerase-like protein